MHAPSEALAAVMHAVCSLLVDLIFVPLFLVVLLSGWRTPSLAAAMANDKVKGMERRCDIDGKLYTFAEFEQYYGKLGDEVVRVQSVGMRHR